MIKEVLKNKSIQVQSCRLRDNLHGIDEGSFLIATKA